MKIKKVAWEKGKAINLSFNAIITNTIVIIWIVAK